MISRRESIAIASLNDPRGSFFKPMLAQNRTTSEP
jgi:hypothetical protein